MTTSQLTPTDRLERLRSQFQARAAGWWKVKDGHLEQVGFAAGSDLPDQVARQFAEATRSVALSQRGLGIVKAAITGEVAVSLTSELPAESGSGLWLRLFDAARSVAVPIRDGLGLITSVVSLALAETVTSEADIATTIRAEVELWPNL